MDPARRVAVKNAYVIKGIHAGSAHTSRFSAVFVILHTL